MDVNQRLLLNQKLLLNQTQIHSLELLTLSNIELQDFLENEYLENPMFEYSKRDYCVSESDMNDGLMNLPSLQEISLAECIREQLNAEEFSRDEWNVIELFISCLDENGFLSMPVQQIIKLSGMNERVVWSCYEILHSLEPSGVFSENLEECLLCQLKYLGVDDPILDKMIRFHLEDISQGRINNITRALKIGSVQAKKYIEYIKKLNPKPANGFGMEVRSFIVPDVIFRKGIDGWEIHMNDDWVGSYQINDYYMRMLATVQDPEMKEYFRTKVARVHFVINGIEQRRRTILKISNAVLKQQIDFFENTGEPVPMIMDDIAKELDIHVSTVSRAIKNKYIQYPGGTILFKELFQGKSGKNDRGFAATNSQIKSQIKHLIESENKTFPLSDQEICNLLEQQQITLSRRAVTKYRKEMGIGTSLQRKEI